MSGDCVGQYTDPTGLLYLRARYYDPTTSQLLTIDPLVDNTRQPYAYVAGDPLNNTDPTGLIGPPCLTCSFHIVTGFLGAAWSATVSSAKCAIPATAGLCLQQLSNTYDANRNIGLSPVFSAIATLDPAVSGYSGTAAAIAAFKQGCWTQGGADSFTGAAGFAGTIGIGIGVGEGVAALTDILTATEAGAGADNVVNGLRLRAQLTGDEIAGGHAFDKHVIELGEFPGITTREQFARTIEDVVTNGEMRTLSNGRTAYWYDGTVVIRNPGAADGGTAFRPTDGYDYFINTLH